jgi:hypothetical protein
VSDYADVCEIWLIAGEVLVRAEDLACARQCFGHVLRHRGGAFPHFRAYALGALAGTLTDSDQRGAADELGRAASAIRARHGFVAPPRLTAASAWPEPVGGPEDGEPEPPFESDDKPIALALALAPD